MLEIESTVNAGTEDVVNPQESTEVEQTESVQSEVAPDTVEKAQVEQSPEENAKFKEVRLKYEREKQEAIDREYSQMYGDSHGIHTKADYEKAVREAKEAELLESMRDSEADPKDIYKQLKASDPDYAELQKIRAEHYTQNQLSELNADLKDVGVDVTINTLEDIAKLPNVDAITKHIENGKTLSEAYFLANKKDLINTKAEKIQQDTIKKIQANGDASTGSLANNGQTTSLYTREQVDAMSQADVNKNYDLVIKSMKTWK
jgi:hypothetical protein